MSDRLKNLILVKNIFQIFEKYELGDGYLRGCLFPIFKLRHSFEKISKFQSSKFQSFKLGKGGWDVMTFLGKGLFLAISWGWIG